MSTQTELAVFERAAESGGRLLRVEADRAGDSADALLLTFDVGRVLVRSSDAGLEVTYLEAGSGA